MSERERPRVLGAATRAVPRPMSARWRHVLSALLTAALVAVVFPLSVSAQDPGGAQDQGVPGQGEAVEPWRAEIGSPPLGNPGDGDIDVQVVGGQVIASPPWMVSGFCGGTLIAPQWVISAQHCGDRTGASYTIGGVEQRTVAQYFPFNPAGYNGQSSDMALWKLDYPSSQQTLAYSRNYSLDDPGDFVYGIGYGNLGADIPNDGLLRSTGWIQIDKDLGWQFEYGEPGRTTCFGDSGGPVIGDANPPNSQLILVGVTSYTVNDPGSCVNLAGAAKVADQAGWIDSVIANNGGPGVAGQGGGGGIGGGGGGGGGGIGGGGGGGGGGQGQGNCSYSVVNSSGVTIWPVEHYGRGVELHEPLSPGASGSYVSFAEFDENTGQILIYLDGGFIGGSPVVQEFSTPICNQSLVYSGAEPTPTPTPEPTPTPMPEEPTPTPVPPTPTPVPEPITEPDFETSVACADGVGAIDVVLSSIGQDSFYAVIMPGAATQRLVESGTTETVTLEDLPDGPAVFEVVRNGGVPVVVELEVACREVTATAACEDDDGRIEVRVLNTTGSFATYRITIAGAGNQRSISSGLATTVVKSGFSSGDQPITVERNGEMIAELTLAVDCGDPVPAPTPIPSPTPVASATPTPMPAPDGGGGGPDAVMHTVTCLSENGRIDTTLVNPGSETATYRLEFEGLNPRQGEVAAGDWWRSPITGRADGDYAVIVTRNGQTISDTTVTVECDSEAPQTAGPEVAVINACRFDNGYLLFQFVNDGADQRGWIIEFEGVPNRSTSAPGFGGAVRAVTGRPDGDHEWLVRIGNETIASGTATVVC